MKSIKPEFDWVLEHAAPFRTSKSRLLLYNFLFIKILSLCYCIFMNKADNISTKVTTTRIRINFVVVEKQ